MESPGNKRFHEIGPIVLACLQKNLQATNRRLVGQNKMVGKRVFSHTTPTVENSLCIENEKMTKWPTSRVFKINLKIIDVRRNEKNCVIFAREFSTV